MKCSIAYLAFFLLLISCTSTQSNPKKVSILGDSYSTFSGYVSPQTNPCWYGVKEIERDNDLKKVDEMWWHLFLQKNGYQLECNDSYSGSTICHTGYEKADYSDRSFITRKDSLGTPDIIFIFGGTNDSWANSPIGEYQYSDWTKENLYSFRPAFAYLLENLIKQYPKAEIYNITNSELSKDITESIETICNYYRIMNINLRYIDKQSGHPSINGMKSIYKQIENKVESAIPN